MSEELFLQHWHKMTMSRRLSSFVFRIRTEYAVITQLSYIKSVHYRSSSALAPRHNLLNIYYISLKKLLVFFVCS